MPKLIDYPRTSYAGAWEIAEVVDDTGGKCALDTCARKLNRKVSGSFKAIVGSAVKFGLLTSKRELLTTTTLFRRIKHAYDKQEELLFHREAFLTPPLFTQLCRKFRGRELPVAMLDVLLLREFGVEEINAQGVAKAFIDGAHMVSLLDEHNVLADIDQLAAQQGPRRELASPPSPSNSFRSPEPHNSPDKTTTNDDDDGPRPTAATKLAPRTTPAAGRVSTTPPRNPAEATTQLLRPISAPPATTDAIANLFGLSSEGSAATNAPGAASLRAMNEVSPAPLPAPTYGNASQDGRFAAAANRPAPALAAPPVTPQSPPPTASEDHLFRIQITGPGINTQLEIQDADDLVLVRALLNKMERQLKY